MKYFYKFTSTVILLTLILGLQLSKAQSDIDMNRMNRDINIMEKVLQEMFKTNLEDHHGHTRIRGEAISFGDRENIRGTYLPGYGVIFTINGNSHGLISWSNDTEGKLAYTFQYGERKKVTQESVTNKIVEFLRDYGSTIGQLSDNDRVMVIFNGDKTNRENPVFQQQKGEEKEQKKIPIISVVATKDNLKAYRSGKLSEEDFRNRLDFTTVEANKTEQKDLRVMASIFETAFEESDQQTFQVSSSVDYLKLDNFGALFSFDARYGQQNFSQISDLDLELDKLREDLVSLDDSIKINKVEIKKTLDNSDFRNRKKIKEKTIKAFNAFVRDLKAYMVDYGRTLKSVESNQHILVSVDLSSRIEEIPERIDMQIQKSVLANLDQKDITREEAINQIQVREY